APPVAQAQGGAIRYVATTGTDTGGCDDLAHPCATVQYAVDQADPGDEVHIATGVYTDVHQRAGITQTVYLSKTVVIRGGYPADFSDPPDSATFPTTLNAKGRGRVFYIIGSISPTVEGLQIIGGNAVGLGWADGGGGYVLTATAILRNNQITGNTAANGGGLYLQASDARLYGNEILGNVAAYCHGGGLYLNESPAVLSGNIISGNLASLYGRTPVTGYAAECNGGGLALCYSAATLNSNTVSDNTAQYDGGGLFLYASNATLSRNTIITNTAQEIGGGLCLYHSAATLDSNGITANNAYVGGGLNLLDSSAELANNAIIANSARYGGGLSLYRSAATFTNDVIADNQVHIAGGGLYIQACSPRLRQTTIARNHGGDGSGIYTTGGWTERGFYYSTVALTNTILVNHAVGISVTDGNSVVLNGVLWYDTAITISQAANATVMVQHQRWGAPAFVASASGDYHLGPGSAAINAGVDAGVTTDLDGDARPGWCFPDLGADEFVTGWGCRYFYLPLTFRDHAP
ncbi:MAG: hypothetical protein KKB13_13215, partial [Chloroflexi bacterium]|nr:hypothetical protein [Chloroflexota bacterium]